MMTAKEYVEDKVKSYTRLSESCRREAEALSARRLPTLNARSFWKPASSTT